MKYLFTALFLLTISGLSAQKSWTFKHELAPQTKYRTDMLMDMDMDMNMELPEEVKAEMAGMMPDSMQMKMIMFFAIGMKTMDATENGLPFVMTYDSTSMSARMNGEDLPLPQSTQMEMMKGLEIKGRVVDHKMTLDSMAGVAITPEMSAAMQSNLQGVQMMINFPERALMIGDTFSQINLQQVNAGAGGNIEVKVLWTLKLESVEGDLATFSTTEDYNFDGNASEGEIKMIMDGDGKGMGTLLFHRGENRILNYTNDSVMNMKMDMGAQTGMEMKMGVATKNHIVVTNKLIE